MRDIIEPYTNPDYLGYKCKSKLQSREGNLTIIAIGQNNYYLVEGFIDPNISKHTGANVFNITHGRKGTKKNCRWVKAEHVMVLNYTGSKEFPEEIKEPTLFNIDDL